MYERPQGRWQTEHPRKKTGTLNDTIHSERLALNMKGSYVDSESYNENRYYVSQCSSWLDGGNFNYEKFGY